MTRESDQTGIVRPSARGGESPTVRLTDMVSETTCRLNGILAAVIGLRECPTDPMFAGVIQLIEDLLAHSRRTEEAAYEQASFAREEEG